MSIPRQPLRAALFGFMLGVVAPLAAGCAMVGAAVWTYKTLRSLDLDVSHEDIDSPESDNDSQPLEDQNVGDRQSGV